MEPAPAAEAPAAAAAAAPAADAANAGKTPVTMLSGFLGAGKTTLLRYLLENSPEKIACIVNDVASINIDAKLVRNDRNRHRAAGANTTADLADTIELANGCACCNLQDELFASFEQVLALADRRGEPYARIVLENSGVAEPHSIRDNFAEAAAAGHPLMERVYLDTLVTLVDASTFIQDYASRLPVASRPELGDGGNMRPVVDLLVEQVECADYVLLNKADLAPGGPGGDGVAQLAAIVASLNPLAAVIACEHGKVDLERVFGSRVHKVVAHLNTEGQHRGAVAAARQQAAGEAGGGGEAADGCAACDAEAGGGGSAACGEGCSEGDHAHHAHHHHHHHGGDGHGHAHQGGQHGHGHGHGHGHNHGAKERAETRAAWRFGIRSFVYTRRRPFHPQRLRELVLRWLPVSDNKALAPGEAPAAGDSPIKAVIRSKGFMWMSSSHATAYYWSHAGQHFEIRDEGDWWAAVPDEEWPHDAGQRGMILSDFAPLVGDRRQEIVFIGVGMDKAKICEQLDSALLTDDECARYTDKWGALPDPQHPGAPPLQAGATLAALAPVGAAAAAKAAAHAAGDGAEAAVVMDAAAEAASGASGR